MMSTMPSNNSLSSSDCYGEETKLASNNPRNNYDSNIDIDNDLRRNYQNAVECLIQCESIIAELQGQLASKDQQIHVLEEKIVNMSLELASSKAFEDEHRSNRRKSSIVLEDDISDDDDESSSKEMGKKQQQRRWSCSISRADSRVDNSTTKMNPKQQQQRRPLAVSLGSMMSLDSSSNSMLDESSRTMDFTAWSTAASSDLPNRRLSAIGQFFRKNKEDGGSEHQAAQDQDKEEEENQDDTNNATDERQGARQRRPPNKRRLQQRMQSSLTLAGVVFPKSFDEVITKGCLELRNSLKGIKLSNEERLRLELG